MKRTLQLVTWNVNGLRAVLQRLGQNLQQFLESFDADIICLQETKLTRSELDQELVRPPGFDAFYSFCRHQRGYSGVVTFVKSDLPTVAAEEGLTGLWQTKDNVGHIGSLHNELPSKVMHDLESEGRCVITDHQVFVLINTYCPALASVDRLEYKLQFHSLLEDRVKALQQAKKRVIVVGDINIAHRKIDHCDPDAPRPDGSSFADHPCRRWMDDFLWLPEEIDVLALTSKRNKTRQASTTAKMIDIFRYLHPTQTKAFTCWNTLTGARQTNYGTRIDYILVDIGFLACVSSCSIETEHLGSDHCPVVMSCIVELEAVSDSNFKGPAALCAKNFKEFSGMQQSIKTFVIQNETIESKNVTNHLPAPPRVSKHHYGQQSITTYFSHTAGKETPDRSSQGSLIYGTVSNKVAKRKYAEDRKLEWQQVLTGRPPPTPKCYCGQPTVLRSVLKVNENWGRKFYVCTKPAGDKGHPDARCDFFVWADSKGAKKPKGR